jgi:hypothetical protein
MRYFTGAFWKLILRHRSNGRCFLVAILTEMSVPPTKPNSYFTTKFTLIFTAKRV